MQESYNTLVEDNYGNYDEQVTLVDEVKIVTASAGKSVAVFGSYRAAENALQTLPSLDNFAELLYTSDAYDLLADRYARYTVFAPEDKLVDCAEYDDTESYVRDHMIRGIVSWGCVSEGDEFNTLSGKTLHVTRINGQWTIGGYTLYLEEAIPFRHGLIYCIHKPLTYVYQPCTFIGRREMSPSALYNMIEDDELCARNCYSIPGLVTPLDLQGINSEYISSKCGSELDVSWKDGTVSICGVELIDSNEYHTPNGSVVYCEKTITRKATRRRAPAPPKVCFLMNLPSDHPSLGRQTIKDGEACRAFDASGLLYTALQCLTSV